MRCFPMRICLSAVAALFMMSACGGDTETKVVSPCEPACNESACNYCDESAGQCVNACGTDLVCEMGQCVLPSDTTCDPVCGECQTCDTSGDTPACVDNCAAGTQCNAGVCEPAPCDPACGACERCDTSTGVPTCVDKCGDGQLCEQGTCYRETAHAYFSALTGPFADGPAVTQSCLTCHDDAAEHLIASAHWNWVGPTPNLAGSELANDVGKMNLINNFCIAIASNEKRCSQCHTGYGMQNAAFDFSDKTKMDCLVCHADPNVGYFKEKKMAGAAGTSLDLAVVARSVGKSTRSNCGSCHFYAGGGDNVKKGDLGSALKNPDRQTDVHMGAGLSCASCHTSDTHGQMLGQGVHLPVNEGRVGCVNCHSESPHTLPIYNEHAQDIACQTCHIPAFSRQQATKLDWDWSTAGNKTVGTDGIEKMTLPDGTEVTKYDFMKGNFVWGKNVAPTYAWYNGKVTRMTITDSYPMGEGTDVNPVSLGAPTATIADMDAKIFPFKVMTGRQPAHTANRYLIVPHLFGPGGFWATIPAAGDYNATLVRGNWTTALTNGARAAGQVGSTDTIADGDWSWVYTRMYLGINHEVAPKDQALGAGGCTDCHGTGGFDFTGLGYSCDPMNDPSGCGSRR